MPSKVNFFEWRGVGEEMVERNGQSDFSPSDEDEVKLPGSFDNGNAPTVWTVCYV